MLAIAAAGLSVIAIIAMTATIAGVSVVTVDGESFAAMVFDTALGLAWQVRMAARAVAPALTMLAGHQAR